MSSHNTERHLKLKRIKDNIRFPDNQSRNLPYLEKEVTSCTTVFKPGCDHKVEEEVENALTQRRRINWCRTIHNVYPLKVTGQGNQFLSVISMALWSFCDAASLLHRLLFVSVSDFAKDLISERWIRNKDSTEITIEVGLKRFVDLARCSSEGEESSSEIVPNEFPHPLHIFVLANILRRPILIVGGENDAHAGLYLPVLSMPEDCTKWPLLLAVYDGLFFPLVSEERLVAQKKLAEFAIPLVSSELRPVKVMFLLEAEENEAFALLQKYLYTTELNFTRSTDISLILSAKLNNLPFEVAGDFPPSVNGKLPSLNRRPVPNIVPSAPSSSIITLNNLSDVSPCVEFVEISLVNERCKEARCPHFASRFIYPYCYEHIDKKTVECFVRTRPKRNTLPSDSSVVMEYCHYGNCRNYTSQYVYPFCYEHLDDHSVHRGGAICSTPKVNEPTISRDFDMSMMAEHCAHPNCNNHASKYTFPVCYEHLDSPLAITRAAAATRVVQLPHTGQPTRSLNGSRLLGAPKRAPDVHGIDKKFEETMKELEARTRNGRLCLKSGCTNFGNGRCRGYCHSCFNSSNRFQSDDC